MRHIKNIDKRLIFQSVLATVILWILGIAMLTGACLLATAYIPECGPGGCAEPAVTVPTASPKVLHTPTIVSTPDLLYFSESTVTITPDVSKVETSAGGYQPGDPTPTSPPMDPTDAAMFTATAKAVEAYPAPIGKGTEVAYP